MIGRLFQKNGGADGPDRLFDYFTV
jgi:hypothetical protein